MKHKFKSILVIGIFTTLGFATQIQVVAEVFTETW